MIDKINMAAWGRSPQPPAEGSVPARRYIPPIGIPYNRKSAALNRNARHGKNEIVFGAGRKLG